MSQWSSTCDDTWAWVPAPRVKATAAVRCSLAASIAVFQGEEPTEKETREGNLWPPHEQTNECICTQPPTPK